MFGSSYLKNMLKLLSVENFAGTTNVLHILNKGFIVSKKTRN
jgi:hypothetical protein